MAIDFAGVASRLLGEAESLLSQWFPDGKRQGHEFKIGDLGGSAGDSLSINLNTGQWKDFASGEAGGDLISLYAAIHGIKQAEAVKQLSNGHDHTPAPARPKSTSSAPEKPRIEWTPIVPIPADAPKAIDDYYRKIQNEWTKLKFIKRWTYTNEQGQAVGHVCRFELYDSDGVAHKDVLPQTWCSGSDGTLSWRYRAMPAPRYLYNLAELLARPDAPVVIVEGEKCAEAVKQLMGHYVGVTWAGGAGAWRKTDLTPLQGRKNVLLWPDLDRQRAENESQATKFGVGLGELLPRDDQPGMRAMWQVGHRLKALGVETVKIIIAEDDELPDGFDVADAVSAGWDFERAKAWIVPRAKLIGDEDAKPIDATGASDIHRRGRAAGNSGAVQENKRPINEAHSEADDTGADNERGAAQDRPVAAAGKTPDVIHADGADTRSRSGGTNQEGDGLRERDVGADDVSPEPGDARGAAANHSGAAPRSGGDAGRDAESVSDDPNAGGAPGADAGLQQGQNGIGLQSGAPPAAPQGKRAKWATWSLAPNGQGNPLANANNATRVILLDASLAGLVWRDEFLGRELTTYRTGEVHEWNEVDSLSLQFYMQDTIGIDRMGLDTVKGAVRLAAESDVRNCVKKYIEATTWDGTPRIDAMMSSIYHCDDNAYTRAVSRNFWLMLVARVYRPGCKADNMIVLEGHQGIYKSTSLAIIGGEWFAEQHESAADPKAFAEILQGKLLIEITEMDAFNRTEVTRIKSAITTQKDRYRIPYESKANDHPRQCVLTGTTNKDDWQRDETGGRRFWPIACNGLADTAKLAAERDQLFAEALARFRAGEPWHEVPDVEAKAEQAKRFEVDAWNDEIGRWLVGHTEVTAMEVATRCLDLAVKDVDDRVTKRIGKTLRFLGWERTQKWLGGRNVKVWNPPGDAYGQKALGLSDGGDGKSERIGERIEPDDDIPFN